MSSDGIVLTDREAELMEVLWDRGPSTVAEVREALSDDLAYTTVLTILRTLETKGFIQHTGEGRAHRYSASVERDAARQSALRALSRKLFKGSASLLLTHLVSDQSLSPAEVRRIRALLDQGTKKSKS
jgi:predicted transcriptional regulator